MSGKLTEHTITSESIYKGRVIDLRVDEVMLPNGKTSSREIVTHPGAVAIIPVTKEGKLILIRQFRKPLEKTIVEIPAGKLEKGEEPLACAKRELEEETGYVAQSLDFVTSFYTSPGFADELIYLFYTNDLQLGTQSPDDDEFVEIMEVTVDEAKELVRTQQVHDAKTAFAIQYLQLLENEGDKR